MNNATVIDVENERTKSNVIDYLTLDSNQSRRKILIFKLWETTQLYFAKKLYKFTDDKQKEGVERYSIKIN